jgi:hypothetical protein
MRTAIPLALLATAFACSLFAAPAQAQRDRVFVASYGSDANTCTFGSPCKTFAHAVNAVAAGGEVTAIDSAGFGSVDITKAVTITSPNGVEAGIATTAGGIAVSVAAGASDVVVLSGLTLEGAGTAADGIQFTSGAELEIVNCAIRNYTDADIKITASAAVTLLISNTSVSDVTVNGADGIVMQTNSGGSIIAALDHVTVNNNDTGIFAQASGGPIEMSVSDSHIDNNLSYAFYLNGTSASAANSVILTNVTMNQVPTGINLIEYSSVWLSQVTQSAAVGFDGIWGIIFTTNTGTAAYSDGTSHFMSTIEDGSLTPWTPN